MRISALGVDGGDYFLLLDVLRRVDSSFLIYKTSVMIILSRHRLHFNILSSIIPEMGIKTKMIVK